MNSVSALSPEVLAKLKNIQFRIRSLVSEVFAGRYESAFKGRGIEFEEVRPYFPGDDVRSIDWNVTARTGEPHIKIFREERELTIMFIVDVSASMHFGTVDQFKSEIGAEITALLAYTALKNNDKIGLIIFSDHVEHYIPPKKGHAHIWRVIRDILSHKSKAHKTDLNVPLEFLNSVLKRKAVSFIISDFFGTNYEKMLAQTARHHDVIAISVTDPKEDNMPDVGLIELHDAENKDVLLIDTVRKRNRDVWKRTMHQHKEEYEHLFRRCRVDHIKINTEENYVDPIVSFFRLRERRR